MFYKEAHSSSIKSLGKKIVDPVLKEVQIKPKIMSGCNPKDN